MAIVPRRRRGASLAGTVLLAAVALVAGSTPALAKSSAAHHTAKPPKLAIVGKGVFWECPARTTSILVAVNQLDLHPRQVLNVNFVVKNNGPTACNYVAPYAGAAPGPTTASLQVGPCGSMGFEILNARHKDVWPGVVTFNCPALGFAQLQPGAAVVGTGSWDQSHPTGTTRMPAGSYTLVVGGHFSFPLKLEAH
ncbi:MAG TPA: hypothetical protein VNG12_07260 [Acidimicrobiales bacterium]|nr:hypothetical protein [Acidimicrobiales bacterium]